MAGIAPTPAIGGATPNASRAGVWESEYGTESDGTWGNGNGDGDGIDAAVENKSRSGVAEKARRAMQRFGKREAER